MVGVPFWPEEATSQSRMMQFCKGDPRWYIWVKSCDQQVLLSMRRDLLLLHENNDLRRLKKQMLPPSGEYITALHHGKMIRGLVLPTNSRNSEFVNVLDVDEGVTCSIPIKQVRGLPDDMKKVHAQAIRCDLGLDCKEQFEWPSGLNDQIRRALGNSVLYVKKTSDRPGSIPTISAEITLFFPSSGTTVDLCQWLIDEFSVHMKICGMDSFIPYPIGLGFPTQRDHTNDATQQLPLPQPITNPLMPYYLQAEMIQLLQQQSALTMPVAPVYWPPEMGMSMCKPLAPPPGFNVPAPTSSIQDQAFSASPYQLQSLQSLSDSSSGSVHSSSQSSVASTAIYLCDTSDSQKKVYSKKESHPGQNINNLKRSSSFNTDVCDSKDPVPENSSTTSVSQNSSCNGHVSVEDPEIPKTPTLSNTKTDLKNNCLSTNSNSYNVENVRLQEINHDWVIGTVVQAFVAHCYDPQAFEITVIDESCALLEEIRDEMQNFYKTARVSLASKVQAKALCGEYCACFDRSEKFWFRAEVLDWGMGKCGASISVWCVDLGGTALVDLEQIQPLGSPLASSSPRLTTMCTMKNVRPREEGSTWPDAHVKRFRELVPEGKILYLRVDGRKCDLGWPVSVFLDENCSLESVNEMLVAEQCAAYVRPSALLENTRSEYCDYDDDPMEEAYKIGGNNYDLDDEDACVAVSGRRPRDEEGICWAYQRSGGHCYKKVCTQKHILLNPDGSTQDKEEALIRAFSDLSIPENGEIIKLSVSRIITVHHFIAQLKIGSGTSVLRGGETLASVLQNINSTQGKRSLKTFRVYPAFGEIVLAKNKNGSFFRGRIVNMDDDDVFQVFDVDDGHLHPVKMTDLRVIDPAYLHHPFQAVECWLSNVEPSSIEKEWIQSCNAILADIVKGKTLCAKVVRSSPLGLEVQLYDENGRDVSQFLKAEGVLKESSIQHLPSLESFYLPGYPRRRP